MDMNHLIDILLEDEEYRTLFERIEKNGEYEKSEVLTILLSISYMQSGKGKEAEDLLKPIYQRRKDVAEVNYWYSSALLGCAADLDSLIQAKGIMLDALSLGLEGNMMQDALEKLERAEENITYLMTKKN